MKIPVKGDIDMPWWEVLFSTNRPVIIPKKKKSHTNWLVHEMLHLDDSMAPGGVTLQEMHH